MPTDKMMAKKDGGIGWMIFNNPERHNAVSLEMWTAAGEIVEKFAADPEVRVLVVTGAGSKAFISGADISQFEKVRASEADFARYNTTTHAAFEGLARFQKPTIAMIRGYCIGGGPALAGCCGLRSCTGGSQVGLPPAEPRPCVGVPRGAGLGGVGG